MSNPIDVSGRPAGSVDDHGRYRLSLTGPGSHVLDREAGRGDLSIGPASLGKQADMHVAPDEAIDWSAFDPFATPAGAPWPRFLHYQGNDSGFLAWARKRKVEMFCWTPAFADARSLDASAAKIYTLQLQLDQMSGHLDIALPPECSLTLSGELSRVTVTGALPDFLSLEPALGRRASMAPYALPELGMLLDVRTLSLVGGPLGQPISLQGIERFASLENLMLRGAFTDWDALEKLPGLQSLEIRFCADLQGLPALNTWPALDRFIAFNVDETAGKRLRTQVAARAKIRAWGGYHSVSQLRKPQWWQREYGRPFSGWSGRRAKAANAAYDTALAALENAGKVAEVQAAITAFSLHFNEMTGIETMEREDIGEAVWQFSQLERVVQLGVTDAQALAWFDEARDY